MAFPVPTTRLGAPPRDAAHLRMVSWSRERWRHAAEVSVGLYFNQVSVRVLEQKLYVLSRFTGKTMLDIFRQGRAEADNPGADCLPVLPVQDHAEMPDAPCAPGQDLARLIVQGNLMSEEDNISPLTHMSAYRRTEAMLIEGERRFERTDGERQMKNGALVECHGRRLSARIDEPECIALGVRVMNPSGSEIAADFTHRRNAACHEILDGGLEPLNQETHSNRLLRR
jgi:hypothetical protein